MVQIKVANSETTFACDGGDSILRAALRAGLGFPYECNVGSCGNCLFELQAGEVVHERVDAPAWTDRHKQRKRYLGCQAKPSGDCTIKVSFRDHYKSQHLPQRTSAKLFGIEELTHDIREFRFRLANRAPFLPGQYALLYVPGVTGARAYSMCNITDNGEEWHFQIKKVAGGSATEKLFGALRTGEEFRVDGPFGMAYLREESPRDILCLAGGSGLSPMISIARGFARSGKLAGRTLHFVYGGRQVRDIAGEAILETLPGYGARIQYTPVISMPDGDAASAAWMGRKGFITDAAKELFGDRLASLEIYFAGPPPMAEAVMKMLVEAKVPPGQIHFDQFL